MDAAVKRAEIESADQLSDLPPHWSWTTIGTIAELRGEKVDPASHPGLSFVGMDDIEPNGMRVNQTRPFNLMRSSANRFERGDILYGRLRPYLNKTALATEQGACSGELLAIVPRPAVDPRYFQYFVHSRRFVNKAMGVVTGDRPRIDFGRIAQFNFPLAPLAEQRRIVARIDELFAEIADGEAALAEARKGLDTFRRALLKAAVTGELTKDWREANRSGETGADLLMRVRRMRHSANIGGKRAVRTSLVQKKSYGDLPESWALTFLEEIGDPERSAAYGVLQPGQHIADGVAMVRVQDVANGTVALDRLKRIAPEIDSQYKRTRLRGGELLITIVGTIGRTAIAPPELAGANTARAVAVVPLSPLVDARWVELWLRSPTQQNHLVSHAHEVARKTLNLEDVRRTPVALPGPAEAFEIVQRVLEALAASDDTLAVLDAEAADAARLKQAILKAAFEGKLVPQDSADEPASALLTRIAAERPAQPVKLSRARERAGKAS